MFKEDLMKTTLEQIIISRGDLEKIYRANISITLWRALNREESADIVNPLYPDIEPRVLPNGDVRNPDVDIIIDKNTGHRMVRATEGMGASLADKPGIFGQNKWDYVAIPVGTFIPDELIITKDNNKGLLLATSNAGTTQSHLTMTCPRLNI